MSFRFTPGRVALAALSAAALVSTGAGYAYLPHAGAAPTEEIRPCQDNLAPSSKTPDPVIEMMNGVLVAEFTPTRNGVAMMGAANGSPLCAAQVHANRRVVLATPTNGARGPWWMSADDGTFLRIG